MYAYNADTWCDDCAEEIKDRILREHRLVTPVTFVPSDEDLDDLDTGDTDEYPQPYGYSTESDCPQHCAGCGIFLENELTTEGADYVREAVREDLAAGDTDSIAVTVWMAELDENDECSACAHSLCEGDFTITPCGPLGGRSGLGRVEGNFIAEFDSDDDAVKFALSVMDEEQFWPDIWLMSDHGNWTLYEGDL